MPASNARRTTRACSGASSPTMSPATDPHPNPSAETDSPVRPSVRDSTRSDCRAAGALSCPAVTLGLENKVALVTGGGRNIGRQICLRLAGHGCDVVVNVRSSLDEARAVADEVAALGRRALAVAADVADVGAVDAMVDQAKTELGRVDILVNNAAMLAHRPFLEMTEDMW